MQEVTDKYLLLEETEKNAVRGALIEERSRFCLFISCLKPVVVRTRFTLLMKPVLGDHLKGVQKWPYIFIDTCFLRPR